MLNSGLGPKTDLAKMDDVGWKAKLKIPPKDIRIKTSVSVRNIMPNYLNNKLTYKINRNSL